MKKKYRDMGMSERAVRKTGLDPNEARYVRQSDINRTTLRLDPACGRAQYRAKKRAMYKAFAENV